MDCKHPWTTFGVISFGKSSAALRRSGVGAPAIAIDFFSWVRTTWENTFFQTLPKSSLASQLTRGVKMLRFTGFCKKP